MTSNQDNVSMSPTSTHLNTRTSAKNGTARTTGNTTIIRASPVAPSGDKPRLTQFQKASHAAEMTQDGFTMVDRSKTYAAVAARKYVATDAHTSTPRTAQKVSCETKDTVTTSVTIKGVLTTAIDSQRVMKTKVILPSQETERLKALREALTNMKRRKALYKAFGVKTTQQVPGEHQPPTATEVAKHAQNFTHEALTMKQPEESLQSRTISMHINKKTSRRTGHHVVPKELKQTLICHHCQRKGHYARNCRTRRKELKITPPTTIRTTTVTNDNRYKELTEEKLEESGRTMKDPLSSPSHLFHVNSLRRPALGNGLDLASPPSHPSSPKRLGATEIQELFGSMSPDTVNGSAQNLRSAYATS